VVQINSLQQMKTGQGGLAKLNVLLNLAEQQNTCSALGYQLTVEMQLYLVDNDVASQHITECFGN
jgi:hypothetical protein